MKQNRPLTSLPENAYRELKDGETFTPMMTPLSSPKEITPYSVTMGIILAIVFSAAAAYLGLKVGQVFDAAIPIAIIAVGMSSLTKKSGMIGQNVIIQSIGACSGGVAAGAIFTLPALYILELDVKFYQMFLSSLFGGFLGIVLLIPFRKCFVKEMHGKYPFPEATATTEILVSGENGGTQAKLLLCSGIIGGIYDFIIGTFGIWTETISTRICGVGSMLAEKYKLVFSINTSAALLGLGYIVGLKYAVIITAGSSLVWFIIVPLVGSLGASIDPSALVSLLGVSNRAIMNNPETIFTAENLFQYVGKPLGIGAIAMAGLISIIRQSAIIKQAVGLAVKEIKCDCLGVKDDTNTERTQRDISMKFILSILIAILICVLIFFRFGMVDGWVQSIVAVVVVFVISFLFTAVSANAIAIVGTNPVSGMTLMTLILSSLILASVGLSGAEGMTVALIIGGVICTALAMAGVFISDLKIGYWMGTTPKTQEIWKFVGTFVSAATVAGVIIILNKTYGFVGEGAMAAPQANAMAAVIKPLMSGGTTPWMLYFCGAVLALMLTSVGVPALAFALGMFIPMELNAPLILGGVISWYVASRTKDKDINKTRSERGTLIASGFIAGGALMGVLSAILKFCEVDWFLESWAASNGAEWTAIVMYGAIVAYFVIHTMKVQKERK